MVSIKDYATYRGVTTQAIYKLLKTHDKELKNHIITRNRKRFINDEGVEILNRISGDSPTKLINATDEYTQRLEQENRNLLIKIAELQEVIIRKSEKIELLQEEKVQLLSASPEVKEKRNFFFWNKSKWAIIEREESSRFADLRAL